MNFFRTVRSASRVLKTPPGIAGSLLAVGIGSAAIVQYKSLDINIFKCLERETFANPFIIKAVCATPHNPQDSVISEPKSHALYLTIHLNPNASPTEIIKVLAGIEAYTDKICPKDIRDEDNEILTGVGFGPNFLKRIYSDGTTKGVENFTYEHRKGGGTDMPATGGDIFIHAKCHERGKLFELAQAIMNAMPDKSVNEFEDVYGWVYRYGRDLSGFIDGTENPADPEKRADVAINKNTGGSYTITQKWLHKHKVINSTPNQEMETWIGRRREDSVVLRPKPANSHVARTTGNLDGKTPKPHEIVRQSQPYGTLSGDSGLFFIAYARSPDAFNWMLDQMAGATADGLTDHLFRLTDCKTGAYFYFPSQPELRHIYSGGSSKSSCKLW